MVPQFPKLLLSVLYSLFHLGILCAPSIQAGEVTRQAFDFNPGWLLYVGDPSGAKDPAFDDRAWKPVTLPRAWNEDDAFRKDIADLPTGIAWYRKHFSLPAGSLGGKVFLEFEGVRQAAEVYVNGQRLALHENGVTPFGIDLSPALHEGENVVAVRTDNIWDYAERATGQKFQWEDRNFNANYGGITKNVRLHVTGPLYQTLPLFSQLGTTGVYVYATDFDLASRSATICVESEVRNELGAAKELVLDCSLLRTNGASVGHFRSESVLLAAGETRVLRASRRLEGLEFWSWGYGYLYDLRSAVVEQGRELDVVVTRTGFRKTEFSKGMIRLNDRVMQVHGYAQRTSNEWPAVGLSVPPWLSDYSNGLMVESGGNLVRWMHITPWRQDVESCDRVGLPQAMPAGDSEADAKGRRWEQRLEVMRDAIIAFRNSPSVLFYESGNRGVSEEHMLEMKALRDRYDPHGGRASGSREMLGRNTAAEYGGEMLYINKSARIPFWAMEYSRDEGLRRYWDELTPPYHKDGDGPLHKGQSAAAYNRNQDSHAVENVLRWYDYWRERPGTGERVSSGGVNIVFSDTNTHHRGAENYRRSGEVDAMRIPKDGFFAHKVMWDSWVDIERPAIHLIGHWNYAPGVRKDVLAVASAEQVELFLNGRSLGLGRQAARFLFTFKGVEWQPGNLVAKGMDKTGRVVCETRLQTAGDPVALRLKSISGPGGLRADGADMALIEVEVIDRDGRRCPTALNPVSFRLEGPAEWRGGIAQGPENCILSTTLPVECGVNRVLLRTTTEAGLITLHARADGLRDAALSLETRPVRVTGGLGQEPAVLGLPARLDRGPTPSGPAYVVSRRAVPVRQVEAGSGAAKAAAAFDDDETTKWVSEPGKPAWIAFEFEREARLTELCLKLPGWRQRSYPIRVLVDGIPVFEGDTPKSLGYVTLSLKQVKGRVLRIELVGATRDQDAFKLVEVANQKITDTGADTLPPGVLSIIEAEFYEQP